MYWKTYHSPYCLFDVYTLFSIQKKKWKPGVKFTANYASSIKSKFSQLLSNAKRIIPTQEVESYSRCWLVIPERVENIED